MNHEIDLELLSKHIRKPENLLGREKMYLEKLVQQTRWIPCSERMPGHGEEVLICTTDGSMTTAEYDNGDWWLVSGGCLEDRNVVTHWMPLLEPPEMPEKED